MVQVSRKEHETNIALIRRFSRRVKRAGIIIQARKSRYFVQDPNKTGRRRAAARREKMSKEYENLYKMGKLDEEGR